MTEHNHWITILYLVVNALETEGKNAIDTPLSPAVIVPNSFKLGNQIVSYYRFNPSVQNVLSLVLLKRLVMFIVLLVKR